MDAGDLTRMREGVRSVQVSPVRPGAERSTGEVYPADLAWSVEGAEVRILIADDHILFAEAIKVPLERVGMRVIDIVSSGADAVASVERSLPDLILMDIDLPDGSGLAAGRAILERWPDARIVALTALEDRFAVGEALRIGFRGYVSKDNSVSKFVNWIKMVLDGQLVFPQPRPLVRSGMSGRDEVALLSSNLSRREGEVLTLLVRGADGATMASRLGISRNTVRTHVQNILTKLQVHSRLEAATFAVRHRLVEVPAGVQDRDEFTSSAS
jgi:two-component system, NarL family, nitrate/nitrite response regulator NarL